MKKLGAWLTAKLPDEMDKSIRLKSIQWTWLYSVVFLIIWMLWESYNARHFNTQLNLVPGMLLASQMLILSVSQLVYRAQLTKGAGEEHEAAGKKTAFAVLAVVLTLAAVAALGSYIVIRVAP